MSRTKFFGYQTPYDEEQARERYLEYLRTASRTSSLKQSGERDARLGVLPTKPTDKTTSEILADEAEMSRVLQQRIAQLVQRADTRPRTPSESDENYEQRTNPVVFVLNRLTQPQSQLLITNFDQIKSDLGGTAGTMLPSSFLTYIDAFQTAFERSGGVSRFNVSTRIIDELEGLKRDLADKTDITNVANVLVQMARALDNQRDVSARDKLTLQRDIKNVYDRMELLATVIENVDYDRIAEIVAQGTESVLEDYDALTGRMQVSNESIFQQLMDKLKTLPTGSEFEELKDLIDAVITSQTMDYEKADEVINAALELTASIKPKQMSDIKSLLINILNTSNKLYLQQTGLVISMDTVTSRTKLRNFISNSNYGRPYKDLPKIEKDSVNDSVSKLFGIPNAEERQKEVVKYINTGKQQSLEKAFGKQAAKAEPAPAPALEPSLKTRKFELPPSESEAEESDYFGPNPNVPRRKREQTEETESEGGFGMKKQAYMAKHKICPRFGKIVGRGISLPSNETKFKEFGKYAISEPQLSKGILSMRYMSNGCTIPTLPSMKISEEFADFLDEFLETQHLDKKRLEKLSADEKRVFTKMINGSGLYGKYKIRLMKSPEEAEEEKRFNLVRGIYISGNDNPEILKELKQFIIKFMGDGRISRKEGTDLLLQLSI